MLTNMRYTRQFAILLKEQQNCSIILDGYFCICLLETYLYSILSNMYYFKEKLTRLCRYELLGFRHSGLVYLSARNPTIELIILHTFREYYVFQI